MHKFKNLNIKATTLLLLLFMFCSNFKLNDQMRSGTNLEPKISGLIAPIVIDDSPGSPNNWAWAVTQTWCSGKGTEEKPYVIKNITINGGGIGSCIEIKNSDKYFIIENCTIYNSGNIFMGDAGIKLYNTTNGLLIKNNCSNNQRHGILLIEDCINNTIQCNHLSNNTYSAIVICEGGNYNKVINNTLLSNGHSIWLRSYKESIFSGNVNPCDNNNISNNYIFNATFVGIFLQDGCSNNILDNNTIESARRTGISLETVQGGANLNNIICNNSINRAGRNPIEISNGMYTKIINNTIIDAKNPLSSIFQTWSNFSTIFNNHIINNDGYGIYCSRCYNNSITKNIVIDNARDGITLEDSENNRISNNTIHGNGILHYCGISLYDSHYNLFYNNKIANNFWGILLNSECSNNRFYKNWFLENVIHATDNGINNTWNSQSIGNFWDNYTGKDTNDDGIGDIPYKIPGTAGSQDNYPIWDDGENVAPLILINNPLTDQYVGRKAPSFNVQITDPNLDSMWYTIDNGINNVTFSVNTTIDQVLWQNVWDSSASNEFIIIEFYANDTFGNTGHAFVKVMVDKEEPSQTIGLDSAFVLSLVLGISIIAIISAIYSKNRKITYKN